MPTQVVKTELRNLLTDEEFNHMMVMPAFGGFVKSVSENFYKRMARAYGDS